MCYNTHTLALRLSMVFIVKRLLFAILCLLPLFATASATKLSIDDYQSLLTLYQRQKNPQQTLLVFDIDDTLLTSTGYLGSTAFWDWQVDLLRHHAHERELLSPTIMGLSDIEGFLLSRAHMVETDKHLSLLLQAAAKNNSSIISLTARTPEFYETTLKQLSIKPFENRAGKLLFNQRGITIDNKTSVAHQFNCRGFKRPVVYRHGVMFVSGQNKGVALQCILNKAHKHYKHIIFVDDSLKNVENVEHSFEQQKRTQVTAVLYTKEHAKESRFMHSKRLKAIAYEKWQHLKQSFKAYQQRHRHQKTSSD